MTTCLRLAADLDPVAPGADGVLHGRVGVELVAQLVEIRDGQIGAAAHGAGVRLDLAQDQLQQRRLPRAVGADEADAVAAQDARREIADQHVVAVGLRHPRQLRDHLARPRALVLLQIDAPQPVAARRAIAAQLLQPQRPAFVARAPRLDALADPGLFLREELVDPRVGGRLLGFLAGLLLLIRGEASRVVAEPAAVELRDAGGDRVEKAPVVRDADHGAGETLQQRLEPRDGAEVEMVGRLVEQQDVRVGRQRLRERDALLPAARKRPDQRIRGQSEPREHRVDAVAERPAVERIEPRVQRADPFEALRIVAVLREERGRVVILGEHLPFRAEAQRDGVVDGARGVLRRLLRDPRDAHVRRDPELAAVEVDPAGEHAEQR